MNEPIDNPRKNPDDDEKIIDRPGSARSGETSGEGGLAPHAASGASDDQTTDSAIEGDAAPPLPNDLTNDWPDEPGNEQLAALALDVMHQRSHLSPQAMARVRAAMHREVELRHGSRVSAGGFGPGNSFPKWFHYGTLLALLGFLMALGFGSVLYLRQIAQHPTTNPVQRAHDIYTVHAPAPVPAVEAPLDPQAVAQELACWRMLPLKATQLAAFQKHVDELASVNPASRWVAIYRLYAMLVENESSLATSPPAPDARDIGHDTGAMSPAAAAKLVSTADAVTAPQEFPSVAAEARLFTTLRDQWLNDNAAALEVLGQRSWLALTGLADLDDRLTRAASALGSDTQRARRLIACRDRLRQAYMIDARHYRERVFALRLLGQKGQADALEDRAARLPALASPQALGQLIDSMNPHQAWEQVLHPLLAGDLALLDPPLRTQADTTATEEMVITATTKILEGADVSYKGNVQVTLGHLRMSCDQLSVTTTAKGSHLQGQGNVAVSGLTGFPDGISATTFSFDSATGRFNFWGDVRLSPGHVVPACTITQGGVMFPLPAPATQMKARE